MAAIKLLSKELKMITFYVYRIEDMLHIATLIGETQKQCEDAFCDAYDTDDYAATYTPAFGLSSGLVENSLADEINLA